MERRQAAAAGDRGGAGIPSLRASRLRLAFGLLAVLLAAGLAAAPLIGAGGASHALLALAGFALVGTAFALTGVSWLLAVALVALAAEFVVRLLVHAFSPALSIGYATGLLVLCELVTSASTLHRTAKIDQAAAARRALAIASVLLVAAAASALTLLGGSIRLGDAVVAASTGAAAAVGLLAAASAMTRR